MTKIQYAWAVVLMFSVAIAQNVQALEAPSGAEIAKVFNYYMNGASPVLVKIIFCEQVQTTGPRKFDCEKPVASNSIQLSQRLYIWMSILVPLEQQDTIEIQYIHTGKVLKRDVVQVSTSYRYRVWKRVPTRFAGKWLIRIMHSESNTELGKATYTVNI